MKLQRFLLLMNFGLLVSSCESKRADPPEIIAVRQAISYAEVGNEAGLSSLIDDPVAIWDGEEPRPAELTDFIPGCEIEAYDLRGSVVVASGYCQMLDNPGHSWPFDMRFLMENGKVVQIERYVAEF